MRLHPALVHFPIALIISAALFYALWLIFKRDGFRAAALLNLDLAALLVLAAVVSGIWAEEATEKIPMTTAAHDLLETHGAIGYAAGGLLAGIAVLRRMVPSL